jgi:hypothetical protein
MQALFGSGSFAGGVVAIAVTAISDATIAPASASSTLTLGSSGTITYAGSGSGGGANWFTPTTASIGSSYWAKLTVNTGTAPNSGTVGSVVSLSAGQAWTWSRSTNGTTNATCTLQIFSDAGGTSLVATDNFSVVVERTP